MPGPVTRTFISGDKIYLSLDNANEDIFMSIVSIAELGHYSTVFTPGTKLLTAATINCCYARLFQIVNFNFVTRRRFTVLSVFYSNCAR